MQNVTSPNISVVPTTVLFNKTTPDIDQFWKLEVIGIQEKPDSNDDEDWNGTTGGEIHAKPNRKKPKGKQRIAGLVAESKQQTELTKDEKVARSMEGLSGQWDVTKKFSAESEMIATANILHDENKNTDGSERKGKKKNRARRNEEHLREIPKEEINLKKETVPTVEIMVPLEIEEKKVKPKKVNPLKDMNVNKFQTRFNAIAELEPEYITFLTNYINTVNTQKAKLDDEIILMRKQIVDKDRLVLQCTDKLTAVEQKDLEIAMLQKTLNEEKRKYKLFEQTVCAQLSSNAQEKSYLQRKYDQLQGEFSAYREEMKKAQSVIHSTPPPIDTKPYQQQIDRLKAELTSSKNRCSQQELELNQRMQAIQQMRNKLQNQDCQIEHLNKTNALIEKRLQDVEERTQTEHKSPRCVENRSPSVGEVVLINDPRTPRGIWTLAKITGLNVSKDGRIRSAQIEMPHGKSLNRPINMLYPLEVRQKDQSENTMNETVEQEEPIARRTRSSTKKSPIPNEESIIQQKGNTMQTALSPSGMLGKPKLPNMDNT
uniref:DUF5641 domain-containing protein n=1 Tax=Onchocerca volvulus TaxID=6282 RepID=A0A8R1TT03_ONCVO